MKGKMQIVDFQEDRGKDKDRRLVVSVNHLPKKRIIEFLEWTGTEFINKGGLYAIDIVNPKGKYRVYKDKSEKNGWINEV